MGHAMLGQFAGQGSKILVLGDKIRFAVELQEQTAGLGIVCQGNHDSFVGLAVGTAGRNFLTLFAKDDDSFFKVTVGLGQGFFAVHHAGSGLHTEFVYICGGYIHVVMINGGIGFGLRSSTRGLVKPARCEQTGLL
jgi:hypothetical protein